METTLGRRKKRKKEERERERRKKERTARCSSEEREREKRERAMVVVQAWDDFYAKAEELLRSKPLDCRYTVKYKHNEGKMVLKVTDDSQVRNENVFK